jgi:cytochrome c biogenesis protein CcmG/thiol:disulfide interchange protein DsbE
VHAVRRFLLALALGAATATSAFADARVGDAAPAFALPDAAGRPVTLESLRGRVLVIDFTASWCTACRTALPELDALGARYAPRGVTVVTVAIDADPKDADRFLAEVVPGSTMTVLYDTSARLLSRFGAAGMPAHYVLDRDGVVRFVSSGFSRDRMAAIETAVERALQPARSTP